VFTARAAFFWAFVNTPQYFGALMKQPHLKIGDVSRVTGVPIPMLGRWLDRRTIRPSRNDKPSIGTGDHRTFSRNTIIQIAIARKLIELGISAGPANAAASMFTEHGQRDRAACETFSQGRTILVIRPTGPVILNPLFDAEFSELADYGIAFVAVDCGKTCNEVDAALNSTNKN
jgi:DNA-binding transcriptional MerR regulator